MSGSNGDQPTVNPSVSVVVPLHNEESTLEAMYTSVRDVLEEAEHTFELLFVDDGSTDGSLATIRDLTATDPRVRGVRLRRNFGKAAALATGFRAARGDRIVTIDADLQDDPAEIPRLLRLLEDGYGVVSGWKLHRRDPISRRIASKLYNWTTGLLTGVRLHDMNCGLKAYSADCAKEIADSCYGELHRYLPVVARWKGFAVAEMRVNHRERANGRSRYGMDRYLWAFLDLMTTVFLSRYARRPMHVFGTVGLLMILAATGVFGALLVNTVVVRTDTGGRTLLTMGAILFIAGLQLLLTGLLAELISRAPMLATRARVGEIPAVAITPLGEEPRTDPLPALVGAHHNGNGSFQENGDLTPIPAAPQAPTPQVEF